MTRTALYALAGIAILLAAALAVSAMLGGLAAQKSPDAPIQQNDAGSSETETAN